MKCSGKSTTWRGSALAGMLVLVAAVAAGQDAGSVAPPAEDLVREAIVHAVRARMGAGVDVALDDLRLRGSFADAAGIVAVLDPSSRLGAPIRVGLKGLRGRGQAARVGEAECRVRVTMSYLEVLAPVARGDVVAAGAVRLVRGAPVDVPMRPLPTDAIGARALRPLAPGDPVLHGDIQLPPAVRNGDTVQLRLATSDVVVTLDGVAAQDGRIGDRIRIVNPSSGRALRGTVIARGVIEVHP